MGLTQTQKSMIVKARSGGAGGQAVSLTDDVCAYLVGVIAADLRLSRSFPELPRDLRPPYETADVEELRVPDVAFLPLIERLVQLNPDADTYFACLAALHKKRLKYKRILETQAMPTIEQVGPRGLLQYGTLSPRALTGLLFWRKWFMDIDNRAGQETGYLFEPIIAHAIGGVPFGDRRSPIRRASDKSKGRQVDCIRGGSAYEFKVRVTIASSGQGRWQEELSFPVDCRESGYAPVLVVLDATPNAKLAQLSAAFLAQRGEVHTGDAAWAHLDEAAGPTMARFLEKYVRDPIQALLREVSDQLPDFVATVRNGNITLAIGGEPLVIARSPHEASPDRDTLPDDVPDELPGL